MSILREIILAVLGVYALLFVCDALFGVADARFDDAFFDSAFYAPRSKEVHFAGDVTPADRIDEVFAQFLPDDGKRGRRYSSLTTFIR